MCIPCPCTLVYHVTLDTMVAPTSNTVGARIVSIATWYTAVKRHGIHITSGEYCGLNDLRFVY